MLNITAKEFVPAASPRGAAIITAAAHAPTAPPKPNACSPNEDAAACTAPEVGCLDGGSGGGAKAQLSPKAPAFVPRAAAGGGCLDAASDPPCSVLDPPRSDSTLSSSIVSREADGCWEAGGEGEGNAEVEQQPEPCAAASSAAVEVAGGYYYSGEAEGYEEGSYGGAPAAQGGELVPSDAYDPYNYGVYNGYVMPYNTACADSLGSTVYYDSGYDRAAAAAAYESTYPQAAYYWDESAGGYVYGDAQYSAQYDGWQQYGGGADAAGWGPGGGPVAADGAAADSELKMEAGLASVAAGADGVSMSGGAVGEEQLRSLAPADAAELLEMFFPHYAGTALSRLLERTGGDLLAAFSELAAMERQVGAERAAAAASGTGGRGAGGGGRGSGGRSPPASKAGGKRSGGGGAAAFKLDPESFPSLPPATSPQPAKAAPTSPSAPAPTAPADAAPAAPEEADAPPATATATIITETTPAPAAAFSPVKPNFAALLRSSTSTSATSTPSAAPSASEPSDPAKRQSQPQPQPQRGGGGRGGGGGGAGRPVRGPASSGAAAVPWVSTGEAVAAQYAEERREAGVLARARNQYFQQATLAFLSGDKALAKQLGRKGREMNEAMKVAHAAAARRIFAQRNSGHHQQQQQHGNSHNQARRQSTRQQQQGGAHPPTVSAAPDGAKTQAHGGEGPRRQPQQQPQQGGESLFVDLHGLHAAEAVTLLEAQIEEARAAGCRFLRVCTGTGHHTKGAKTPARLPAAVADTLLANHLTFKTLKPGLLEAQL